MIQFIVVSSFLLQDYISFIFLLVFFFVVFSFGVVVVLIFGEDNKGWRRLTLLKTRTRMWMSLNLIDILTANSRIISFFSHLNGGEFESYVSYGSNLKEKSSSRLTT